MLPFHAGNGVKIIEPHSLISFRDFGDIFKPKEESLELDRPLGFERTRSAVVLPPPFLSEIRMTVNFLCRSPEVFSFLSTTADRSPSSRTSC